MADTKKSSRPSEEGPFVSDVPVQPEVNQAKVDLQNKINAAEQEFGGISNIPLGHAYWDYVNQIRSM